MKQGTPATDTEKALAVDKLKAGFSKGYTISEACLYAGIAKQTYYNWFSDNKDLCTEFDQLRETLVLLAKDNVHSLLLDGDKDITKYVLDRRSDEFKPKQNIDSVVKTEAVIDLSNVPQDVIDALEDAIENEAD